MKQIKTVSAAGHVLCHDITQIIRGVTKDAAFRKGHVVTEEDIPVLLSLGKENLFVWEKEEGMLHEDEAAEILYNVCAGDHMHPTGVKEGKIEVIADCEGLLLVDTKRLLAINSIGEVMIATRHGGFPVKKGDKLAGTRIIPLVIREDKMNAVKAIGDGRPLLKLIPFLAKQC
ncbi:MAG: molybdopterin-binding protein, partial [Clostridiales bacterium]|nr:molybdopterin-binding protein [Clostridiales bacterium]